MGKIETNAARALSLEELSQVTGGGGGLMHFIRAITIPGSAAPDGGTVHARYANGVKLVMRPEGWIGQPATPPGAANLPVAGTGTCPVRFEGDEGWVETGDSGKFGVSAQALLASGASGELPGQPHVSHVRDFLNCVKSRGKPRVNADVACTSCEPVSRSRRSCRSAITPPISMNSMMGNCPSRVSNPR